MKGQHLPIFNIVLIKLARDLNLAWYIFEIPYLDFMEWSLFGPGLAWHFSDVFSLTIPGTLN